MLVLLLALSAAAVLAQEPRPCQSPRQFEGRLARIDRSRGFAVFAHFSYDEDDRRIRESEEVDIGSTTDYFDVLYLHNIGKEYRYNYRTKNCTVSDLTRPFIPFGVPPDARFRGEGSIGASGLPDEHVTAVLFEGEFESNPYAFVVTSPDCFPIEMDFYSNRTGAIRTTFYDITIGIHDPSRFIPPPECPQ
ncbi:mammalian ependymin-related protein 1-like [Haliotis asinina]|uniref:mammalian ependymin-related protein 1-like n=1 Tax=Haliotis asinina TaxID=109174 RepID=UPI0035324D9C